MAKHLEVSDFMSSNITSVDVDEKLLPIAQCMQQNTISCVMVLENDIPVGIITERCIVHYLADHYGVDPNTVAARDLMPPQLVTIKQHDSLFEAMVLCRSQRIKHLAVVDDEMHLAGLITYSDLVDANFAQIEQQAALLGDRECPDEINAQLMEMTLTDPLMDIGNRRSMEIDLKQTHELSTRYSRPYSIALIDVDFFKKFNDFYGHRSGDDALKQTAACLKDAIRNVDRLYRYGGEELLLLMPETQGDDAFGVAQRLVNHISDLNIPHEQSPYGRLSASIGVASFNLDAVHEQTTEGLIEQADIALYAAKEGGRSQARIHTPEAPLAAAG